MDREIYPLGDDNDEGGDGEEADGTHYRGSNCSFVLYLVGYIQVLPIWKVGADSEVRDARPPPQPEMGFRPLRWVTHGGHG